MFLDELVRVLHRKVRLIVVVEGHEAQLVSADAAGHVDAIEVRPCAGLGLASDDLAWPGQH